MFEVPRKCNNIIRPTCYKNDSTAHAMLMYHHWCCCQVRMQKSKANFILVETYSQKAREFDNDDHWRIGWCYCHVQWKMILEEKWNKKTGRELLQWQKFSNYCILWGTRLLPESTVEEENMLGFFTTHFFLNGPPSLVSHWDKPFQFCCKRKYKQVLSSLSPAYAQKACMSIFVAWTLY